MARINLFYMSKVKFGGFASYTSHLCKAFRDMGHTCNVYKIRKRDENKERDFGDGIGSYNISIDTALHLIRNGDYSIVTATFWRGWHEDISKLLIEGAELVLHDHTDYRGDFKDFILDYNIVPIVIRPANKRNLENDGIEACYIPHPYVPYLKYRIVERDTWAISVCRMDYDKHTDILIKANEMLPEDRQIQLWGAHTRMYMFQKIVGKYKGWDDSKYYTGPNYPMEHRHFDMTPGHAVKLNATAHWSCDMSAIKGDGGGTQYSFLEAIDGGAILVLNRKWFVGKDDELVEDKNCVAVDDAEELADLLEFEDPNEYKDVAGNALRLLTTHSPNTIIPLYMNFLGG